MSIPEKVGSSLKPSNKEQSPRKYPFDAIVVLGASMVWNNDRWEFPTIVPGEGVVGGKSRAIAAAQAMKENLAPFLLVTGGIVYRNGEEISKAVELSREIIHKGALEEQVVALGSQNSKRGNTRGNMEDLRDFLESHPEIQHIGILTNDFHVARARMFMHQFLPSYISMRFIQLNRLLNNRSSHYQRWIDALRSIPEMQARRELERKGRNALRSGTYQPKHS